MFFRDMNTRIPARRAASATAAGAALLLVTGCGPIEIALDQNAPPSDTNDDTTGTSAGPDDAEETMSPPDDDMDSETSSPPQDIPAGEPEPEPTTPPSGDSASEWENDVIELTNVERAEAGCDALTPNDQLGAAARKHSEDMVANDYFDHTSLDGRRPGDRIQAEGYNYGNYGENISTRDTPAIVVDGWMASEGHRDNMLNCDFEEIGVGLATEGNSEKWTQVLAKPSSNN